MIHSSMLVPEHERTSLEDWTKQETLKPLSSDPLDTFAKPTKASGDNLVRTKMQEIYQKETKLKGDTGRPGNNDSPRENVKERKQRENKKRGGGLRLKLSPVPKRLEKMIELGIDPTYPSVLAELIEVLVDYSMAVLAHSTEKEGGRSDSKSASSVQVASDIASQREIAIPRVRSGSTMEERRSQGDRAERMPSREVGSKERATRSQIREHNYQAEQQLRMKRCAHLYSQVLFENVEWESGVESREIAYQGAWCERPGVAFIARSGHVWTAATDGEGRIMRPPRCMPPETHPRLPATVLKQRDSTDGQTLFEKLYTFIIKVVLSCVKDRQDAEKERSKTSAQTSARPGTVVEEELMRLFRSNIFNTRARRRERTQQNKYREEANDEDKQYQQDSATTGAAEKGERGSKDKGTNQSSATKGTSSSIDAIIAQFRQRAGSRRSRPSKAGKEGMQHAASARSPMIAALLPSPREKVIEVNTFRCHQMGLRLRPGETSDKPMQIKRTPPQSPRLADGSPKNRTSDAPLLQTNTWALRNKPVNNGERQIHPIKVSEWDTLSSANSQSVSKEVKNEKLSAFFEKYNSRPATLGASQYGESPSPRSPKSASAKGHSALLGATM